MAPSIRRQRNATRIGITPLVDVVFILMIFFMLASRFTHEGQIDLSVADGLSGSAGETRLLLAAPATLSLDGESVTTAMLAARLRLQPSLPLAVKPVEGATIQRVITLVDLARAAGVTTVVLTE